MSQLDPSGSFYSNNPIDSERWVKVIAATSEYESLLERGIAPEIETFVDLYSDVPREILIAELRQLTQEYQQSLTPSGHDQVPVSGNQGGYSPSDRYSELEAIGYGGMGEIYRGLDQECSRFVAIKKLRQDHQRNPEAQKRFHTEAEITAGLEHPGIVPVYGKGVDPQGLEFYAMRLISGEGAGTLSDSIQKLHQQVSAEGHRWRATYLEQIRDLVRRLVTVCDTVAYAHSRGIVHRDLKPSNILIGPYGETLIADWGLARKIDPLDSVRSHPAPENRHGIEISTGGDTARAGDATSGIGTPGYSAPELAQSPQTHLLKSADIYSLGAILLCMLHGRNPGLMADSSSGPWSNNTFASLEAIGRKAMDADLSVRYSTVEDFRQDLLNCMAGEPVSAVPEGYWERAIRWPSRHRVAAAGLASATVIAILAGSLMVWLQAQQSRLNDSLQSQSRDILHFILNDLENEVSPSPSNLDRLSQTTHRLATMESSLGRHDEANATFDRTCQALIGIQNDLQVPKDTRTLLDYHIGRLRSLQGILSMRFGRNQQAKPQLEESIQRLEPLIHDKLLGQMERLDATHASAGAMSALAMHDLFQGNPDVAKSLQDKAIELIGRQSPTNYEHAMMRVQIHGNMSLIYEQQKEPEKALEQLELAAQIVELSESMITQKPGGVSLENQAVRPTSQYLELRTGIAHQRARILQTKQEDRAAIVVLSELLQKQTHTLLHYPPDSAATGSYQWTASRILSLQLDSGDHAPALELVENWQNLAQTLLDRSTPNEPLLLFLILAHHSAGHVLEQLGQRDAALERYRKALLVCQQTDLLKLVSAATCYQRVELEIHEFGLLLAGNQWSEAHVHFEQAFEAARKLWSISPTENRFNHLAKEQLRHGIASMKDAQKQTEAAHWESELAKHP